jgi:hypothetical protein
LRPGIQKYGDDAGEAKFQDRGEERGYVDVASSKVQRRLRVGAEDTRHGGLREVGGDGDEESPDGLAENDGDQETADPPAGFGGRRFRRGGFQNFIHG